MAVWQALLDLIEGILTFFHDLVEPMFGIHSWGWAIILLTIAVRVFLLPLAIKQTRSQRAMQTLQPEMKRIQEKYKVDRGLMRTDPEKYRDSRAKQQEAMMALYKEHGVNPASGCQPLLAQLPIFFALFQVLQKSEALKGAPFYLLPDLAQTVRETGPAAWFLVFLMALTTYYSSRQLMMASPSTGQMAQQQKIMMYAMPVVLTIFSLNLYLGVLLYWVTTNVWTIGQQFVMFRGATTQTAAAPAAAVASATADKPKSQPKNVAKKQSKNQPKNQPKNKTT